MNEIEINGRKVALRDSFPLEEFFGLANLADAVDYKDLRTAIPLFVVVIDSWEFDGDPKDPAAYMGLDVRREIMPLSMEISRYVTEFVKGRNPKN